MGRLFQKRLEELGGECVYNYGEGDNSESLEDSFEEWSKGFWTPVGASVGVSTKADPEVRCLYCPRWVAMPWRCGGNAAAMRCALRLIFCGV